MSLTTTTTTPVTALKRSTSIDNQGNIIRDQPKTITYNRRAPVFGVANNILTRSCSSIKPGEQRRTISRVDSDMHGLGLSIRLQRSGVLAADLVAAARCVLLVAVVFTLLAAVHMSLGKVCYGASCYDEPVAILPEVKEIAVPIALVDDDKALQVAFETEFTCRQVVEVDATQCSEVADNGNTVRFYCAKSCTTRKKTITQQQPKPTVPVAPKETTDGSYNNWDSQFTQCAAVGSVDAEDTCGSADNRGQGCSCSASSQCGAVQGSKCCYQGFCGFEHLAPLDPCM